MNQHPLAAVLVAPAIALGALLLLVFVRADADDDENQEHVVVLELGATGEREISERTSHLGPTVGIEIEPIENWLEIEFGASTCRSRGATNWELELPFKKPFRLTSTVEIMPGLGPAWSHTTQPGERASSRGAEVVLDLFFWRSKHRGWYLEPSYGIALGNGNKKSAALTGGLFCSSLKPAYSDSLHDRDLCTKAPTSRVVVNRENGNRYARGLDVGPP